MEPKPQLLTKRPIVIHVAACARPARDIISDSLTPHDGATWQTHQARVTENGCMMAPTSILRETVENFATDICAITRTITNQATLDSAVVDMSIHMTEPMNRRLSEFRGFQQSSRFRSPPDLRTSSRTNSQRWRPMSRFCGRKQPSRKPNWLTSNKQTWPPFATMKPDMSTSGASWTRKCAMSYTPSSLQTADGYRKCGTMKRHYGRRNDQYPSRLPGKPCGPSWPTPLTPRPQSFNRETSNRESATHHPHPRRTERSNRPGGRRAGRLRPRCWGPIGTN